MGDADHEAVDFSSCRKNCTQNKTLINATIAINFVRPRPFQHSNGRIRGREIIVDFAVPRRLSWAGKSIGWHPKALKMIWTTRRMTAARQLLLLLFHNNRMIVNCKIVKNGPTARTIHSYFSNTHFAQSTLKRYHQFFLLIFPVIIFHSRCKRVSQSDWVPFKESSIRNWTFHLRSNPKWL